MNENKSIIGKKSFAFVLKIIDIYKKMYNQKDYVLSKQLLRSGTSIGQKKGSGEFFPLTLT